MRVEELGTRWRFFFLLTVFFFYDSLERRIDSHTFLIDTFPI